MEDQALTYEIVDSIERIPRSEWEAVFGDEPEGWGFYRTLESSGIEGFEFFYAVVFDRERILAIAPLFACDYRPDAALGRFGGYLLRRARRLSPRLLTVRTLFCGSPIGEYGVVGIRPDAGDREALLGELVRALEGFSRARGIPLLAFKDFRESDDPLLSPLLRRGFRRVRALPSVAIDLTAPSFDGYLRALSRATRKDVRRKVKKALAEARVRVEIADDIAPLADEIHRLYRNTREARGGRAGMLTREFFVNAGRYMRPEAKFFLYRADGRLAAFNLCFAHGDVLIDKCIGFDYDISRSHNLYFVSWFCNIEWCLDHGVRRYLPGQTGYGPKLRLGGKLVPLRVYLKHRKPLATFCLAALARAAARA